MRREERKQSEGELSGARSYAFLIQARGSWKLARPINEPDELRYLDLVTSRSSHHFREFWLSLRFRSRSPRSSIPIFGILAG